MLRDLRNLPAQVVERLSKEINPEERVPGFDVAQRGNILEARFLPAPLEMRVDDTSGNPVIEGYATVYEFRYDVFGGPPFGWTETMKLGSWDRTVKDDDIRLLINHEGIPLGRSRGGEGTLRLTSDQRGVHVRSEMDAGSPLVQSFASAMERGDMDEMSVAFRALRQDWNEDYTERDVVETRGYDVSGVTFPANPAAVMQIRRDNIEPGIEEREQPVATMTLELAREIRASVVRRV